MDGKKQNLAEIPVSFRIEVQVQEYIEEVMLKRREFNKSKIHREIFMMGLEIFKKQNSK